MNGRPRQENVGVVFVRLMGRDHKRVLREARRRDLTVQAWASAVILDALKAPANDPIP